MSEESSMSDAITQLIHERDEARELLRMAVEGREKAEADRGAAEAKLAGLEAVLDAQASNLGREADITTRSTTPTQGAGTTDNPRAE